MRTSSAESYQRSLGPAAASLADKASADALVFADIRGFRESGGEIAWNMASSLMPGMLSLGSFVPDSVYPSKGAALLITLVDGPSGDVLWQNVAATQNVDFVAPGVVESMVEQAFAKLPGDSGAEATADARSIAATRTAVAASADGAAPPSDPSSAAKEDVGSSQSTLTTAGRTLLPLLTGLLCGCVAEPRLEPPRAAAPASRRRPRYGPTRASRRRPKRSPASTGAARKPPPPKQRRAF